MEPRCTCGAVLPEDARFCHKCGKPQLEEDVERLAALENISQPAQRPLDVPAQGQAVPLRIGFGNLRAVAITMAVAAFALIGLLLTTAASVPMLAPVVLCAAGFIAARYYRKRTAQPLSAGSGAYLGLMTGLWLFLVLAICSALVSLYVGSPAGREMLRASLEKVPQLANSPDTLQMLDDPHQFLVGLLKGLIPTFFLVLLSSAFGGMLAARMSLRRPQA